MIRSLIFVYGHISGHINWGEWHFLQLPSAGELVSIPDHSGALHNLVVRNLEHMPVRADVVDQTPSVLVITDWQSKHE